MHCLKFFALLLPVVAATPIKRDDTSNFYLKTANAGHPEHNGLYVYGYHTGAGLNDAVLTPDAASASPAYMNGSFVQFELDTPFPWGLAMHLSNNYAAWEEVFINAVSMQEDFFVNNTGLQWSQALGFGGWLVCDWNHNDPQLFYINRFRTHDIPPECSEVILTVENIQ